jgi:hypothetical protein
MGVRLTIFNLSIQKAVKFRKEKTFVCSNALLLSKHLTLINSLFIVTFVVNGLLSFIKIKKSWVFFFNWWSPYNVIFCPCVYFFTLMFFLTTTHWSMNVIPLFKDGSEINNFLLVDTEGCKIPKFVYKNKKVMSFFLQLVVSI